MSSRTAVARILCETRCLDVRPSARPGALWEVWLSGPQGEYPRPVHADNVVLAPGVGGTDWLGELGQRLRLVGSSSRPAIGVHLEGPRDLLTALLKAGPDPLITWRGPDGTSAHCVAAHLGEGVIPAPTRHGAAPWETSRSANRAQLTLLARSDGPQAITSDEARALTGAGSLIAQTLGDYLLNRPTGGAVADAAAGYTPALPKTRTGSLSAALPRTYQQALTGLIVRLAQLSPPVLREQNMLYGLVTHGTVQFEVTDAMEATGHPGLYLAGDGPGLTDGIVPAAETGWLAGDAIAAQYRPPAKVRRLVPGPRRSGRIAHDPTPAA